MLYGTDLSYVHHAGFASFAEQAAPALLEYLRRANIESGLIVDLGCGSGVWASYAFRAGYDVLGVDVSPAMIEIARRVAPECRYLVGSAHVVGIPSCVAVTALGESISYLPPGSDDFDVEPLFRRVFNALASGGMLIFDVVERSTDTPMEYETSREGPDWTVHVEVSEDAGRHVLTRAIRVSRKVGGETRVIVETHRLRTFDRHALRAMLAAVGFTVESTRSYGGFDLPPQRLGFVAQKRRV